MSAVSDAAKALAAACAEVSGLIVYTDLGGNISPPGVVIAPPTLTWEGTSSAPSLATFQLYVLAGFNDSAQETLWDLVPRVAEAVNEVVDAVATTATPTSFPTGGSDLPAYLLTVEIGLDT